jgi:hypothetical protein
MQDGYITLEEAVYGYVQYVQFDVHYFLSGHGGANHAADNVHGTA